MEYPSFDILDIGGSLFRWIQYACWSFTGGCCDIINELLGAIDGMGIFTLSLDGAELAQVWNAVASVCTHVAMPISYALLGFFVAAEFYSCLKHVSMSKFGGLEAIMRCIIKIWVVKLIIDQTLAVMKTIYDLSVNITNGVERYAGELSGEGILMPKDALQSLVESCGTDQLGMLILFFIVMLVSVAVVFAATVFVQVIALSRYIEIFICIALAAIPITMLLSQQTQSRGISFLAGYFAVCLQGTIIVLLVKLMTPLFGAVSVLLGQMISVDANAVTGLQMLISCVAPLGLCLAMFTTIRHTREYANRLVNGGSS